MGWINLISAPVLLAYCVIAIIVDERARDGILRNGESTAPLEIHFRRTMHMRTPNFLYALFSDYQVLRATYTFETADGERIKGSAYIASAEEEERLSEKSVVRYRPQEPEANTLLCPQEEEQGERLPTKK